jgi:large subunit ribosomal protein L18e
MMIKMEKTDESLTMLIAELKTKSLSSKERFWKALALELERPTRQRRVVNLSKIDRFTSEGDFIVVPGKVLSAGELSHPLTIAAWKFSGSAKEKIEGRKAKGMSISELLKQDIKGKKIRIMG